MWIEPEIPYTKDDSTLVNMEEEKMDQQEIVPTNEGWIGHFKEDIETYVPLQSYVNLEFDENTIRDNSQIELENWIKSL